MKDYPLEQLLRIRDFRIDLALRVVTEKQRVEKTCQAECDRLQAELEKTLIQRMAQQREMSEGKGNAVDIQRRDQHIALLAERAQKIGVDIVAGRKALEAARAEVQVALKAYHKACAKRDALLECKKRWRKEQNFALARSEEQESEELTMFRFVK